MNWTDFTGWSRRFADWTADYHRSLRTRPVRAQVAPGRILDALPEAPPELAEEMEKIFTDFEKIVLPGMTHWQHPVFSPISPPTPRLPPFWPSSSSPPWRRNACSGRPRPRRRNWKRR